MISPWFDKTRRRRDWLTQLNRTLAEWSNRKFKWGSADCFCFAAACIEAQTGLNPMDGFIGSYGSKKEAYLSIHKGIMGTDGKVYRAHKIEGYITMFLGSPKPVLQAQRGDVVLVQNEEMQVTCIVDDSGKRLAAMTENDGLIRLPLSMGVCAWSV